MNNLKGKAISIEGGDGSGKGTLIKNLKEYFSNYDLDILYTREPGGSFISEQIRDVIVNKENINISYKTEALLFAAARAQLMKDVIRPALKKNKTIILDRFVDSSYVYQGYCRKLGIEKIKEINNFATGNWSPDKTIVLDIDPEISLNRIHQNNKREINRLDLETLEFHKLVREGYQKLAEIEKDRIILVDANQTQEKVFQDIINILKQIKS